jgi:PPM family protein phosphatase
VQNTIKPATWKAWGQTDQGRQRQNNEDRVLCDAGRGIFVVADGMGGEAAGEVAAQQAVDFIAKRLSEETGTAARRLREAITSANNEIYRLAERNPEWRGMACVLTAGLIEEGILHVGHVGDSRLYRVQNRTIRKITPDHSPIGQKEDSGELTELEAMRHPRRNEVFRDVGSRPHKPDDPDFIEYLQFPLERNAAYVFCSDGLSDMLSSREILSVMLDNVGRPQDAVRGLIEKANAAGGKDNISVIVVESEDIAVSANGNLGQVDKGLSRRIFSPGVEILRGRWTLLFYGIVAGFLAFYFWNRLAKTEVVPPPVPSLQFPAVLYVAPGSQEYPTISSALEAAHAGDRIEIADGEYEEIVRLKDGVDMAARFPGMAILHIAHVLPNADAAITADGIKRACISGLTIKADPAAALPLGIRISNSNINIVNMEVSGAVRAGIFVEGDSRGVIAACYVYANIGPGILTAGTAAPLMIGNLVYANGTSRAHFAPGLYITGGSIPEVRRNTFSGNGAEAIRIQKQELKDKMTDNLFVNSRKTIVLERIRQ